MPRIKKSVQKYDLAQYRTYIVDQDPFSQYFRITQLPEILTGGKSGFLINGSAGLVRTTEVLVELIDANGNTIYVQPVRNYQEGLSRLVSIEVYEDTPPGPATLTVLGELAYDLNGNPIPKAWRGSYNVKWQKIINVDPLKPNVSTIRLYNRPVLAVTERLVPFRDVELGTVTTVQNTGIINAQYIEPSVNIISDENNQQIRQTISEGTSIVSSTPIFSRNSLGGRFQVNVNGAPFTSSISDLFSDTQAKLKGVVTSSTTGDPIIRWSSSEFLLAYSGSNVYTPTYLNRSFADLQLTNLTTFTGDVQKVKFYAQGVDQVTGWELIEESALEAIDLLTTESLDTGEVIDIGEIIDYDFLTTHWEVGTIDAFTYNTSSYFISASLGYNTSTLLDSMYISSASTEIVPAGGLANNVLSTPRFYFSPIKELDIDQGVEYTLYLNVVGTKSNPNFDSQLDIYLSGNKFQSIAGQPLGYRLGTFVVPRGSLRQTFSKYSINFIAPLGDTAKLRFAVYGGTWYVAGVHLKPARESGFNPDRIAVTSPIIGKRFERLQFKAELYDASNVLVPVEIVTDPIYFDGGNAVFKGFDNRIEGEMSIVSPFLTNGIKLTTAGFYSPGNVTYYSGSAIYFGSGTVLDKDTPFLFGVDTGSSPQISIGDKLHGYIEPSTGEFILKIFGTILVGSGSSLTDIRNIIPQVQSNVDYDAVRSDVGVFYSVRGRRDVSAGEHYSQVGRMGEYTRGYNRYNEQPELIVSGFTEYVDTTINNNYTRYTSGSITIPSDHLIFNNTIYATFPFTVYQPPTPPSASLVVYQVDVLTDWTNWPDAINGTGQSVMSTNNLYITSASDYSPAGIVNFPIFVPNDRTTDTLYITVRARFSTSPSAI